MVWGAVEKPVNTVQNFGGKVGKIGKTTRYGMAGKGENPNILGERVEKRLLAVKDSMH